MSKAKQKKPQIHQMNIVQFETMFPNEEACAAYLSGNRWPDGVIKCPTCGNQKVAFIRSRMLWECSEKHTKRQFSVKIGTVMEDSAIKLDKWLVAMWLIANSKNGISSYELARALGVTQKTAWFMLSRLRLALQSEHGGKQSAVHFSSLPRGASLPCWSR